MSKPIVRASTCHIVGREGGTELRVFPRLDLKSIEVFNGHDCALCNLSLDEARELGLALVALSEELS